MLLERPAADGTSTGQALVVGASVAAGENQLLPEVLEEAQAVARFDKDPSLLMGEQATAPEVMARLRTAEAIHFAGHAESMEGGTRLLLAPAAADVARVQTSWLDSAMLRRHPPRLARLAVFSACSSGKKEAGWNHGMGDIVDAMAALGVADVVATRWQIDGAHDGCFLWRTGRWSYRSPGAAGRPTSDGARSPLPAPILLGGVVCVRNRNGGPEPDLSTRKISLTGETNRHCPLP